MANFDFAKLMEDPMFQMGMTILGNSRQPDAIGKAFAAQRQAQELQQQKAFQNQQIAETQRLRTVQEENAARQQAKDEATQKRQQDIDERNARFMEQAFGMIGGQPKPPMAPDPTAIPDTPDVQTSPVPQPQTQVDGGPTGRYGTPTQLLDNLMQVESGGNARAINPTSKAMGHYQFLPSTVQMLQKQGIKLDPFNPEQSRDAADQYIQQLVKQHGSYEKALAAYGGFKTKDPTSYVGKVLKGVVASQPQEQAQVAPQAQGSNPLDIARLGAMGALGGMKGGREMLMLAQQMRDAQQSKTIPLNAYQQAPNGTREFVEAPPTSQQVITENRKLAQKDTEIGLEQQRTAVTVEQKDAKIKGEKAGVIGAAQETVDSMDMLSKAAKDLEKMPGLESTTGLKGIFKMYNMTEGGRDAAAALETLQSKVAVDQLMKMKALSANGASGFGALSGPELRLLETYTTNLSKATSLIARKKALKDLTDFAELTKTRVHEKLKNTYGSTPITTSGTSGGWTVREVK